MDLWTLCEKTRGYEDTRGKVDWMFSFQNAACYNIVGESDGAATDGIEENSRNTSGSLALGPSAASICYGRNMTFPRQAASSYAHTRRELPAVVTEGENYRLSGEVSS